MFEQCFLLQTIPCYPPPLKVHILYVSKNFSTDSSTPSKRTLILSIGNRWPMCGALKPSHSPASIITERTGLLPSTLRRLPSTSITGSIPSLLKTWLTISMNYSRLHIHDSYSNSKLLRLPKDSTLLPLTHVTASRLVLNFNAATALVSHSLKLESHIITLVSILHSIWGLKL